MGTICFLAVCPQSHIFILCLKGSTIQCVTQTSYKKTLITICLDDRLGES